MREGATAGRGGGVMDVSVWSVSKVGTGRRPRTETGEEGCSSKREKGLPWDGHCKLGWALAAAASSSTAAALHPASLSSRFYRAWSSDAVWGQEATVALPSPSAIFFDWAYSKYKL